MSDAPHSRACGLYCRGHGSACSPDCPTCGGADASPTGEQVGPGYVMTTHGPVLRPAPPWDIPWVDYSPSRRPVPAGAVEALEAEIARAETLLANLRAIREQVAR